jgi:hypothetical protein
MTPHLTWPINTWQKCCTAVSFDRIRDIRYVPHATLQSHSHGSRTFVTHTSFYTAVSFDRIRDIRYVYFILHCSLFARIRDFRYTYFILHCSLIRTYPGHSIHILHSTLQSHSIGSGIFVTYTSYYTAVSFDRIRGISYVCTSLCTPAQ